MSNAADPRATAPKRGLPLATVLIGGVTALIVLATGGVLALTLVGAARNTLTLLEQRAALGLDLLEARIEAQLAPVLVAAKTMADQIERRDLAATADKAAIADAFRGALTSLPQVTVFSYLDVRDNFVLVARLDGEIDEFRLTQVPPGIREALAAVVNTSKAGWVDPFWIPQLGQPALALRVPVFDADAVHGVVSAIVTLGSLARFLDELEQTGGTGSFVLYDEDYVLGLPRLLESGFAPTASDAEVPLPRLELFDDPAFALVRGEVGEPAQLIDSASISRALISDDWVVLMREITAYGAKP